MAAIAIHHSAPPSLCPQTESALGWMSYWQNPHHAAQDDAGPHSQGPDSAPLELKLNRVESAQLLIFPETAEGHVSQVPSPCDPCWCRVGVWGSGVWGLGFGVLGCQSLSPLGSDAIRLVEQVQGQGRRRWRCAGWVTACRVVPLCHSACQLCPWGCSSPSQACVIVAV